MIDDPFIRGILLGAFLGLLLSWSMAGALLIGHEGRWRRFHSFFRIGYTVSLINREKKECIWARAWISPDGAVRAKGQYSFEEAVLYPDGSAQSVDRLGRFTHWRPYRRNIFDSPKLKTQIMQYALTQEWPMKKMKLK